MEKEITIPTSLHEVYLERLIEVLKIAEVDSDNQVEKSIAAMFKIPLELVMQMSQASVETLYTKFVELTTKEYEPMYRFSIGETEFAMIPDFNDKAVQWKEFTDASMYINNILENNLEAESIKRFMSVLFRPIVTEENGLIKIEPYESSDKYYDMMGKAPASAFQGAKAFFLTLRKDCLSYFQTSMIEGTDPQLLALEESLTKVGGGMEALETLRSL